MRERQPETIKMFDLNQKINVKKNFCECIEQNLVSLN